VIAGFFIGPLIHPASSRATLYTGIVACVAIIPLAMVCGSIRGIPFYWRLIDCSFGVIGVIPLIYCLKLLRQMEDTNFNESRNSAP
jgi:exosortase/archaeosortase